ncbi:MAG: hypothetical protein RLZZ123_2745 [Pseudomonadota bacterium]
MIQRLTSTALALALALLSSVALAQTGKTLRFVVGYPPGGSGDFVTRTVGEAIASEMGVNAVIENRPGAAGNLATEVVVKSTDGATLLVASNPYINKALYKKLNYDIEKDLTPITLLGNGPMVIAVHSALPVNSIPELIAHAKKNPGRLNFASSGNGSAPHLAGVLFNSVAEVDIVHIPFKGGAPAVQSVIAGDTQVIYGTSPVVLPQVRGGRIRALAITTQEKSGAIPGIMGMKEAGLPHYNISFSFGLYAPSSWAAADVQRVFEAAFKVLQRNDIRDKLATQGMDPAPNALPADFKAANLREAPMWAQLITASGAKVD